MHSRRMYLMPPGSQFYALIPMRRWYAPWVWDLDCVDVLDPTTFSDIRRLASNLRRDEILGMLKMLGVQFHPSMKDMYLGDPR